MSRFNPIADELAKPRRTIIVNQTLTTANFIVDLNQNQISFDPKVMIIKQILYSNIGAGTDSGTYLLYSDLTGNNIAAFYMGIQGVVCIPETIVPMRGYQKTINFIVVPANANFTGPTGQLTMTLEFIG